MVDITVVEGDVAVRPCDLLILKHADGFHGVDEAISRVIGFEKKVPEGASSLAAGRGIAAAKVLYLGVGEVYDFRYEKIRRFASDALQVAAKWAGPTRKICTIVHGPGYGLDSKEAFLSLVSGFSDAIEHGKMPDGLACIEIVELNSARARSYQALLRELGDTSEDKVSVVAAAGPDSISISLASFGSRSEAKRRLFVAMPFADKHSDVWDIAIQEACTAAGIVCERVKEQAYVGDVLQQIRRRLGDSSGLIALLDDANPNVFLELGYAWALDKPTVLLRRAGEDPPFDVRGQRCLVYSSIAGLRKQLTEELRELAGQGVFG